MVVCAGQGGLVGGPLFHMCLLVCFKYCFCCVFVFRVVVCAVRVGWVGGQVFHYCVFHNGVFGGLVLVKLAGLVDKFL